PADIIGSEVLDEAAGRRSFRFLTGPVFCQLLMADELNRASPRTQSAPLPEAQLDRFLLEVDDGYPALEAERTMLLATTGMAEAPPEPTMTSDELRAAQALIRRVPVGEKVVDAILSLVRGGRPETADEDTVRRH